MIHVAKAPPESRGLENCCMSCRPLAGPYAGPARGASRATQGTVFAWGLALTAVLAPPAGGQEIQGDGDVSGAIERQLKRAIARAAPSVLRIEVTRIPNPDPPKPAPAPAPEAKPPEEAPAPEGNAPPPEGKAPAPRRQAPPAPGGPRFPDGATPPNYFRRPAGPSGASVAVVVDPDGGLVTSLWNVADDPPQVPTPPGETPAPRPPPGTVTEIRVLLPDGRALPAKLLGTDPNNDLAYLRIEAAGLEGIRLAPIRLAGEDPRVGDLVAVVSRAPGAGGPAATFGNVSASGRLRQTAVEGGRTGTALQVSARLNYGNSGAAVVNLQGELVGFAGHVTHLATDPDARKGQSSGVGFATPVSRLRTLLGRLRAGEKIPPRATPYLGVRTQPAPSGEGASLVEVVAGSPADKAGLRRNDVILVAGETRVESGLDLTWAIQQSDVGEPLRLVVLRGEERIETTATLGARPDGRRR